MGVIKIQARVVGVTFENEEYKVNRQEIISGLKGSEKIYLKREPTNRFDSNAVAVVLKSESMDMKLGYLRAELAGLMADMWKEYKFVARIKEIRIGDIDNNIPWGLTIEIGKFNRSRIRSIKEKKRTEKKNLSNLKPKRIFM